MNSRDILAAFGEKIFNRIMEDTPPGGEFLLSIIDPDTFKNWKKKSEISNW